MTVSPFRESFEGLTLLLGEVFGWFDYYMWSPRVVDDDNNSPEYWFFDSLEAREPTIRITVDLEREEWFCPETGDSLPFPLYETLFSWVLGNLSFAFLEKVQELELERVKSYANIHSPSTLSHEQALAYLRWTACIRALHAVLVGELDEDFKQISSDVADMNRSSARQFLKIHAHNFWQWTRPLSHIKGSKRIPTFEQALEDFDASEFDDEGWDERYLGCGYLKAKFRQIHFFDDYELDPFLEARKAGERAADQALDLVMARKQAQNQRGQELNGGYGFKNSRLMGWVIPLVLGLIIAIGASLGY
jgi:hypothetical protein